MKLYFFVIIAIGLMYTFYLGGVDTGSSQIIDFLQMGVDQNATIKPTVSATTSAAISGATTFWIALALLFLLFGTITATRINIGVAQFQATTEGIIAAISGVVFGIFALDFYSILKLMQTVTGGYGWQFHLTWILIVPFLFGFALSLIQFIKGTE